MQDTVDYVILDANMQPATTGQRYRRTSRVISLEAVNDHTIKLTTEKSTISADGSDTATITATVYDYTGAVETAYSEDINFVYDGNTKSVTPTNGVATLTFATSVSGDHLITTNNADAKNGSVTIHA